MAPDPRRRGSQATNCPLDFDDAARDEAVFRPLDPDDAGRVRSFDDKVDGKIVDVDDIDCLDPITS